MLSILEDLLQVRADLSGRTFSQGGEQNRHGLGMTFLIEPTSKRPCSRRNLLTRGVPLNDLIGRTFQVGETILQGVELSEPCRYVEGKTGKSMRQYLDHRGGLRARVLREGTIRRGDPIVPCDPELI